MPLLHEILISDLPFLFYFCSGVFYSLDHPLPAQSGLLLLCLHHGVCPGRCGQSDGHYHLQTAALCSEGNDISDIHVIKRLLENLTP